MRQESRGYSCAALAREYDGLKSATQSTRSARNDRPARSLGLAVRGTALAAVAVFGFSAVGVAQAAPEKPSPIAGLVNEIADVDQNLTQLAESVALKRENVNKALIDFQNAVAAQQVAVAADNEAQNSLKKTTKQVEAAQREFDEFMRSVNRQGNNMGSMTEYVASDDPDKILEQMSAVEQTGRKQRETIERLRVIRNQQANRVAATSATRRQTDMAAKSATARRTDALTAAQEAENAARDQQGKRDALVKQREELTKKLDRLKKPNQASETVTGRDVGEALQNLPRSEAAEGDLAGGAIGAVTDIALDAGSQVLTSLLGDLTLPNAELLNERGLGGSAPRSSGPDGTSARITTGSSGSICGGLGAPPEAAPVRPGLRGPEAVELVVNRAMSTLGTPTHGAAATPTAPRWASATAVWPTGTATTRRSVTTAPA